MCARWMFLVFIVNIHLKSMSLQHYSRRYHHDRPRHYYEDDLMEYDESEEYPHRRSHRHKKSEYSDSEECECSCNRCEPPKPCCKQVCNYCSTLAMNPTQNPNQPPNLNPNNPNNNQIVFLPYPYPLVIPNMFKSNSTTSTESDSTTTSTTTTTTTEAPTTTKRPKDVIQLNSVEDIISGHRSMKQLNPNGLRTKPAWVPKYGIVPIPDHLAAKLMSQLTEVRALKARRL